MLHLFFTISFISEIIVAYWVIKHISKLRKSVVELNDNIVEFQPIFKANLVKANNSISQASLMLAKFVCFIDSKRSQCKDIMSKNLLSGIVSFVLKFPYKKVLSVIEIILTLKKVLKF